MRRLLAILLVAVVVVPGTAAGVPDGSVDCSGQRVGAADAFGTYLRHAVTPRLPGADVAEVDSMVVSTVAYYAGPTPFADESRAGQRLVSWDPTGDADADCVSNRRETRDGTDPLDPDSDGDGTSDGRGVRASTVREAGVVVTAYRPAGEDGRLVVRPVGTEDDGGVEVGPMVTVSARGADRVRVAMPVDESAVRSEAAVWVWDPSADQPWHPVDTARSPGWVNATVKSDYFYVAPFDREAWRNATTATVPLDRGD